MQRLATDVHVAIAGQNLKLPFIALDDYAYRKQSFSLDRNGDRQRELEAANRLVREASNPEQPLARDAISVKIRTFGWNDLEPRQREICPLLTREWSRSVCDNPWAAIQQALPVNRFELVDLRRLQVFDKRGPLNCIDADTQRNPVPEALSEVVLVCQAQVYGTGQFYSAAVRIAGDLGAVWTVGRSGQHAEAAKATREGEAISAFVRYALGTSENYRALHDAMCRLRRPGSVDGPGRSVSGCP